jgi:glycine cleavage system aminomethyltransferase T
MSLDFLSFSADGPVPRSPLGDAAFTGAAVERRGAWDVAVSYGEPEAEDLACREAVGWSDVSHLPKAELTGPSTWLDGTRPGFATTRGDGWVGWISPRRVLVLGNAGASPDGGVLDLTCALGAIVVSGPAARETIARFCALDTRPAVLPELGFRPGSVARAPGFLMREQGDRFFLIFGAAYGQYLWEVVSDAGARLGGRPVGVDVSCGLATPREASVGA